MKEQRLIIEQILKENGNTMWLSELSKEFRKRAKASSRKTIYLRLKELSESTVPRIVIRKSGKSAYILLLEGIDLEQVLKSSVALSTIRLQEIRANFEKIPKENRHLVLTSLLTSMICDKHVILYDFLKAGQQLQDSARSAIKSFDELIENTHKFILEKCEQDVELNGLISIDFVDISYWLQQNLGEYCSNIYAQRKE